MTSSIDLPEGLQTLLREMDLSSQAQGLPWVTLSYAQSLDGSIAARRGTPLALSGSATLEITHHLRARHQAILIGIDTLLADDPQLNVRLVSGEDPQPVVLDNQLRFPLGARLLQGHKPPWIMTSCQASAEREAALIEAGGCVYRTSYEQVELREMLGMLGQQGIRTLMVEGGARVITAFLGSGLVDALVVTISPLLVGGVKALEELTTSGSAPQDFPRLTGIGLQRLEDDMLVWGRLRWAAEA